MAIQFQKLQEKVDEKSTFLAEKKAELADLAVRAAQEDALKPDVPIKQAKPLAPDQIELFDVLRSIVSKSNVLELIKTEGATELQLNAMESMWSSVSQVVHTSVDPLSPPAPPSQQGLNTSAPTVSTTPTHVGSADGTSSGAVNIPAGHDEDMDVDSIEPLWQKHLVENPEINQLEAQVLEQRRATFMELQRTIKRSKTSSS